MITWNLENRKDILKGKGVVGCRIHGNRRGIPIQLR